MLIANNHILEATTKELYEVWLLEEWDEVMPFDEYILALQKQGVKVTITSSFEKVCQTHTNSLEKI